MGKTRKNGGTRFTSDIDSEFSILMSSSRDRSSRRSRRTEKRNDK